MPCKLLDLPPELRLVIYDYIATSDTTICIYFDGEQLYIKGSSAAAAATLTLLGTCKKVRREAYSVVWDNLHFDMMAASLRCDYGTMYRSVGHGVGDTCLVARQMRHVQLLFSPKHYHYDHSLHEFLKRAERLYTLLRRNTTLKSVTFDCDASMDGDDTEIDGAFERETAMLFKVAYDELRERGVDVHLINTELNGQTVECQRILLGS